MKTIYLILSLIILSSCAAQFAVPDEVKYIPLERGECIVYKVDTMYYYAVDHNYNRLPRIYKENTDYQVGQKFKSRFYTAY